MNIQVLVIPHHQQRYDTCGDWWFEEDGTLQIRVSDTGNEFYNFLIASHEMKEAVVCYKYHISEKEVSAFDIEFESDRQLGLHGPDDEPGDDPDSPYRFEHFFATTLERLEAAELDVNWKDYEQAIRDL